MLSPILLGAYLAFSSSVQRVADTFLTNRSINLIYQEHIIFINLFCTPRAAERIVSDYPNMTVLTTELHPVTPNHFGQRYFGTDHVD